MVEIFFLFFLVTSSPNPSPPGATVSAWFDPAVTSDVDKAWTGLTNALAGQLCASLNFLYSTQTISPNMSFQPKGVVENGISVNSSFFRIGFLPGENVCTENLSPWKKLLPCQAQRGKQPHSNNPSNQMCHPGPPPLSPRIVGITPVQEYPPHEISFFGTLGASRVRQG